ncbi:MAG: hypothetical protein R3E76_01125 [Planctomycetota bacterium]
MARGIDRLIHLLLRERLGDQTPPDLSSSILDAIDGKQAPVHQLPTARQAFQPWMGVAAGIAVCAALALGVSAWLVSKPPENAPITADGNQVRVIPSEQEQANRMSPEPSGSGYPAPQCDPVPHNETKEPDEPKTEHQVEQPPAPEPEPKAPAREKDPVVEEPPRPEPEPQPEVQPEPKPPEPETDPVVEQPPQPEPEPQRPPSETQPTTTVKLASVVYAPDKARLEFRNNSEDKWADLQHKDVTAGMQLRARRPVALELDDGARVYFDGEILLAGNNEKFDLTIEDESVYFDVYGSKREFVVRRGEASLSFRDAELLAEKSGLRMQVSCLGGEVTVGDVTLKAGWTASLSDKGLSREKFQGDRGRYNPLVASMDQTFVLMREELNRDAISRVYFGDWNDGVVRGQGEGDEKDFGIELSNEIVLQERAYLRMRVRINGDQKGLNIGFGSGEEEDWRYFQSHHGEVQPGEWTIVRVPLSALMDDGDKKKIWPGAKLHKFQIVLWDKQDASVDVDWFEVGIEPEWAGKENGETNDNKENK